MQPLLPIAYQDVLDAADRLRDVATRTPVMTSRTFDERAGEASVFFKCEQLQRGGAFKFRGAYNHLAALSDDERRRGIVAASSGNHAQGVALAGRLLALPVTILMPSDAPATKIAATRGYGAVVEFFDRDRIRPDEAVRDFAERSGSHIVPSFDDPFVMAGQGTAVLELIDEVGPLDWVVTPLGGGGLLSGTLVAAKGRLPGVRVAGFETEGADDWMQSLVKGERVLIDPPTTIADGIRTRQPGLLTFEVVRTLVDTVQTVSDAQVKEAVRFLVQRMKLVVEPTGAVAPAGVLAGGLGDLAGQRVGVIISGGNVDPDVLCAILSERD